MEEAKEGLQKKLEEKILQNCCSVPRTENPVDWKTTKGLRISCLKMAKGKRTNLWMRRWQEGIRH